MNVLLEAMQIEKLDCKSRLKSRRDSFIRFENVELIFQSLFKTCHIQNKNKNPMRNKQKHNQVIKNIKLS